MNKTPGQAAYEAFQGAFPDEWDIHACNEIDWLPWASLPENLRQGWDAVGDAAVAQHAENNA